jgi:hypothetical protein
MTRTIQIRSKRARQPPTRSAGNKDNVAGELQHQPNPTVGAKEHPYTNQIRRKTKVMSPENWEEGGAEGQAALVAPPPKALHLED